MARLLAILAATFLVVAFALAALLPPEFQLDQLISASDPSAVGSLRQFCAARLPTWVWTWVANPLLQRPCWLIPACFGLLAAGAAMTVGSRPNTAHTRRWRS